MMTTSMLALAALALAAACSAPSRGAAHAAQAQPQAIGSTSSSSCPSSSPLSSSSTCLADGDSNYVVYTNGGSFSPDSAGRYTVQFTANLCPKWNHTGYLNGVAPTHELPAEPDCLAVSLPASGYVSDAPLAQPLRGQIGYSVYGVSIYGNMENGFTLCVVVARLSRG